jgi:predicted MPP superfamily phosphohydrolase
MNNSNTSITRGPDTFQLSGVDDWTWNAYDWPRAVAGLKKNTPTVLLSHQPMVLDLAETQNVSLILSGHTHGGQIDLPLLGPPVRFATREMKYSQGLYKRGETQLYVSSGTGVVGLPVRFGVRPEIAVFRLKRAV